MINSKLEKIIKKYKDGKCPPYIKDMIEEFKKRDMKNFRCGHFDCNHCPFNELMYCNDEQIKKTIIKYKL